MGRQVPVALLALQAQAGRLVLQVQGQLARQDRQGHQAPQALQELMQLGHLDRQVLVALQDRQAPQVPQVLQAQHHGSLLRMIQYCLMLT